MEVYGAMEINVAQLFTFPRGFYYTLKLKLRGQLLLLLAQLFCNHCPSFNSTPLLSSCPTFRSRRQIYRNLAGRNAFNHAVYVNSSHLQLCNQDLALLRLWNISSPSLLSPGNFSGFCFYLHPTTSCV